MDDSVFVATARQKWVGVWFRPTEGDVLVFPSTSEWKAAADDPMLRITLPDLQVEKRPNPFPAGVVQAGTPATAAWICVRRGRSGPGTLHDESFRALPARWPDARGSLRCATPDGRYLVIARAKKHYERAFVARFGLDLVETEQGRSVADFSCMIPIEATAVAVEATGSQVAIGTGDGLVRVLDAETNEARQWQAHKGEITSVIFLARTGALLSCGVDGTLGRWDPGGGKALVDPVRLPGAPRLLATDAAGRLLLASCFDGSLRCFDAETLEEQIRLIGNRWHAAHVALSADGQWAASFGAGRRDVRLWRTDDDTPPRVLRGHRSYAYGVSFRPDGARIATAEWDGVVCVWCRRTGRELLRRDVTPGVIYGIAYSGDGRRLSVTTRRPGRSETVLLDAETLERLAYEHGDARGYHSVYNSGFRTDADVLLSARRSVDGIDDVTLLDPVSFEVRGVIPRASHGLVGAPGVLATGDRGDPRLVRFFDPATGVSTGALRLAHDLAAVPQLDPRGGRIAVLVRQDGKTSLIRVYEVASGRLISQLALPWSDYSGTGSPKMVFSRDGRRLFTGSADADLAVWDVDSGERLTSLKGHHDYIMGIAMSPDGKTLATSSGDLTVRLWDVRSRRERYLEYRAMMDALERMKPHVDAILAADPDRAVAVEAIRDDGSLDLLHREAALQLLAGSPR